MTFKCNGSTTAIVKIRNIYSMGADGAPDGFSISEILVAGQNRITSTNATFVTVPIAAPDTFGSA